MKFLLLLFLITSLTSSAKTNWGKNGHRAVGDIAAHYLHKDAKETVKRILGNESLAIASTWMDEIRANPKYDYTHDWHWVTIPGGLSYEQTEKNPNGDIIHAIQTIITDLKKGNLSAKEEEEKLKMLIHLVGDIHMPLHVGTGKDRGGNDTKVKWFWKSSNLHRVWDSGMIDEYQLSYTELSASINHPTQKQIKKWQNSGVPDWANESMELRDKVYDLPKDKSINYEYMYHNFDIVKRRLLQAGVRLAGVLNEIYGGK